MRECDAPKPTKEQKERSAMTTEEWNTYFSGHWNFAGAKQEGHLAMFPEELPHRLIKMFAFRGDTVLDPVNAHLIKSGLVGLDSSYEYRYRGKFLDIGELVQS